MESSRRDLFNDVAERRSISKNNQNTYYPRFSVTPKTDIAFPKTSVLFLLWSDYSHAVPFKMYSVGFRAFKSPPILKCVRLVSVRSSLSCINIGLWLELTFKKCPETVVVKTCLPRKILLFLSVVQIDYASTGCYKIDVGATVLKVRFFVSLFHPCLTFALGLTT